MGAGTNGVIMAGVDGGVVVRADTREGSVAQFNVYAICIYALSIDNPYSKDGIADFTLDFRILTISVAAWQK